MELAEGLFELPAQTSAQGVEGNAPLAARVRPRNVSELVGQGQVLRTGSPLRRLLEGHTDASVMLYGPPGSGKTTIARMLRDGGHRFVTLSAVHDGVKEIRQATAGARGCGKTVLFVDEIHRFAKPQQDALLPVVEEGAVLLVAATTENPYLSVAAPLLSRLMVIRLKRLDDDEVVEILTGAVADPRGLNSQVTLDVQAAALIARLAGGDARAALNLLETAALAAESVGAEVVGAELVESLLLEAVVPYDQHGDRHHDVVSAFIKSVRGSDPDAALHYLARMLVAGEDPVFIARRLVVHASEDIGLADPSALQGAVAAAQAVQLVGMPEARLALAQATLHLAVAPKSNSVLASVDAAMKDIRRGGVGEVPSHLRFSRVSGAKQLGHGKGYRYPHRVPEGVLPQQYPPDALIGKDYYQPTRHGREEGIRDRVRALRAIVRQARAAAGPRSPNAGSV